MKTKIYIKRLCNIELPQIIAKGDWIDLRCAENTLVGINPVTYIPLGIAVKLPDGYEAIVCSRSSSPNKQHIWNASALGIIDNSYCGNNDQWMWPATTIGAERAVVEKGSRICQFRIQLSQKATLWQRIKDVFSNGIEIVEVDNLDGDNRGGLGSTGKKAWVQ